MERTDPRIDAYIERAAPFARPILQRVREVVHRACPEARETMKWGFPHFDYKGILVSTAAFKEHCTLAFWNAKEVVGPDAKEGAMGQFGRIGSVKDLPSAKVLEGYVKKAMALKDRAAEAPRPRKPARPRPAPEVPSDLAAALDADGTAAARFAALAPSHRREYIEWIEEAKRSTTRARRIEQTVAWVAEGKSRNWKYMER